jgi:hypothetical protein
MTKQLSQIAVAVAFVSVLGLGCHSARQSQQFMSDSTMLSPALAPSGSQNLSGSATGIFPNAMGSPSPDYRSGYELQVPAAEARESLVGVLDVINQEQGAHSGELLDDAVRLLRSYRSSNQTVGLAIADGPYPGFVLKQEAEQIYGAVWNQAHPELAGKVNFRSGHDQ